MLPAHMLTATVQIEYENTARSLDRYNRPVDSPENTLVEVKAYYRPRRTSTVIDGAEQVDADMQVFLQPNVSLENAVAVHVERRRYSLNGQPQPHWHPTRKTVMYQVVLLRRATSEVG